MKIDEFFYLKNIPFKSRKSQRNTSEFELRVYELETYIIDSYAYSLLISFLIKDEVILSINIHLIGSDYVIVDRFIISSNIGGVIILSVKSQYHLKFKLSTLKIIKQLLFNICDTNISLGVLGVRKPINSLLNLLIKRWNYSFESYISNNKRVVVVRNNIYLSDIYEYQ